MSDEVYEHIIFDGARHESMARYEALARPQLHRRIVRQDLPCHRLEDRLRRRAGGADGRVPEGAPVRDVFDDTRRCSTRWPTFCRERRGYPELSAFYQRKRDLFLELIAGSRWKPLPSRGTYFQLLDYSAITDERDMDFALRLTQRARRRVDPDVRLPLQAGRRRPRCASVSRRRTKRSSARTTP